MKSAASLFPYQEKAIEYQATRAASALWLDMGLGKTVITLSSIVHLLNCGALRSVLIVAPIRVCRLVWRQEALKWNHTEGLTFSLMVGTRDQRVRALTQPANVYLVNYENLEWLSVALQTYYAAYDKPFPFDGIVFDEISKCKNSSTNRVKMLRRILPAFKWRTGLTGTPASNGYKDLHGQFLVLDDGVRLGTSKSQFETRWYKDAKQHKKIPYADTQTGIKERIGDMTLEMSAADYNPLPDMIINDVEIELTEEQQSKYDAMEREFFIKLDSGADVEIFNTASLMNKCLQFSNGFMYPVAGMPLWEPLHDLKLDALEEIIEESGSQQILCSYAYRADAERIMLKFKHLRPINLTECKSEKSLNDAMTRWKSGSCKLMIGHPGCLGKDTLVFTERNGWTTITDVELTDRVFDGVEFVSHKGCHYSGYKDVIDVVGITMTPDHKLLIDGQWKKAKDVQGSEKIRDEAIRLWEKTTYFSTGGMPDLRYNTGDASPECDEVQQARKTALYGVQISPYDRNSHLENLDGTPQSSERQVRQKLRWVWNKCMRRVGIIQTVLRGYVTRLLGRFDYRENRREWSLRQEQLSVGNQYGATIKQAKQSSFDLQGGAYSFGRSLPQKWSQQDDDAHAGEPRNECGTSDKGCSDITLWKKPESEKYRTSRKTHVYDLVDCGPRHRFVIKNANNQVFISHNSMGHGLDGLQDAGNTLVWFGMNWSLDLVDQFNARIRRQGQGHPVICHRIICPTTLDTAQILALEAKSETQTALRKVIRDYRNNKQNVDMTDYVVTMDSLTNK